MLMTNNYVFDDKCLTKFIHVKTLTKALVFRSYHIYKYYIELLCGDLHAVTYRLFINLLADGDKSRQSNGLM